MLQRWTIIVVSNWLRWTQAQQLTGNGFTTGWCIRSLGPRKSGRIRAEADFQESTVMGQRGNIDSPKLSTCSTSGRLLIFLDPFLINVHPYIDPILCISDRGWAENILNVASLSLLKIVKVELYFKTSNQSIWRQFWIAQFLGDPTADVTWRSSVRLYQIIKQVLTAQIIT